ncbi:MAG TPA: ATP-binding cassette domain-containing protein [Candidatus Eisenbacteria bacterium]|nr:ATP-binding cassette domain-containing protein [Candidatus Eisenbacteria bacterium]
MNSSTDAIVNIQKLAKTYPGKPPVEAVKGIDLAVERGELFGLLGPNGAGKSTTISVCTTRSLPTAGRVTIAGVDVVAHPSEARRYMGVVTQFNTLDRQCTVWENLYFHCRYFGIPHAESARRTAELIQLFKLTEKAKASVRALSGGLAQRVQIARAIAHNPEVLFLDEPSAGLDPQTRLALWDIIRVLRQRGITIVLTTHYMEEADQLCGRVAIIDHGKILVCGTPEELKSSVGAQKVFQLQLTDSSADGLRSRLQALPGITSVEGSDAGLVVFTDGRRGLLPEMVAIGGDNLRDISVSETTLESVFIKLTGRDLRD